MNVVIQCFQRGFHNDILEEFLRYNAPVSTHGVVDLNDVYNEKLKQLIQVTLCMKEEYLSNCSGTKVTARLFELSNEQVKLLNRLADGESVWIAEPLYVGAKQLFDISRKLDQMAADPMAASNDKQIIKGDLEQEKYMEKCVRTVHTSFKLCLNDRNPNTHENKKWGVYMFTNLELRIYKLLHNRDMVRNLVKVMESRTSELPTPEQALGTKHRAQLVTYYYYMAEYYGCHEANFDRGFEFARKAWLASRADAGTQENMICLLLVPFAILARKRYPDLHIFKTEYPAVAQIYAPAIECLRNGDLWTFAEWIESHEPLLLRQNLYVPIAMIRELVLLKLIKIVCKHSGSGSIVSLRYIAAGLVKSETKTGVKTVSEERLDSTECVLANLISKGYIKGYLSHSNRALVVSKTNAFPRLTTTD
ncbi:LADA_0F08504g1_1 [Lachancea dasiensis]|uniref:LADA_0F08504g1_1 n=1 Tax=Lachancea dasiensis TaxID=1072105 RepID=A0A1G4JL20_9SACH|nr:LADA_0F08504g1_1 [Lachancea dasiensis]